jgi:hypothetical protein
MRKNVVAIIAIVTIAMVYEFIGVFPAEGFNAKAQSRRKVRIAEASARIPQWRDARANPAARLDWSRRAGAHGTYSYSYL